MMEFNLNMFLTQFRHNKLSVFPSFCLYFVSLNTFDFGYQREYTRNSLDVTVIKKCKSPTMY